MTPEAHEVINWVPGTIKILVAVGVGLTLRIVSDWFMTGRMSPGVYMKVEDCQKIRTTCGAGLFKQEFIEHRAIVDQQIVQFEKRLTEGSREFKLVSANISEIQTNLAVLTSLMQQRFKDDR